MNGKGVRQAGAESPKEIRASRLVQRGAFRREPNSPKEIRASRLVRRGASNFLNLLIPLISYKFTTAGGT